MIESPVIQEIVAETEAKTKADTILALVRARFGPVPAELATAIKAVRDRDHLDHLVDAAALCPDLATFRARVNS